jgi:hypothetical protein
MSFSPRDKSRNRQTNNEVTRDDQGGGNENQKKKHVMTQKQKTAEGEVMERERNNKKMNGRLMSQSRGLMNTK